MKAYRWRGYGRTLAALCVVMMVASGCGEDEKRPAAPPEQDMSVEMGPMEPVDSPLGGECVRDGNCAQGLFCDRRRPGGYCTRLCESAAQCEPGQICSSPGEDLPSSCFAGCGELGCRDGYTCVTDSIGMSACIAPLLPPPGEVRYEDMLKVLGADCAPTQGEREERGWRWSWEFEITREQTSFLMVPFVERGLVYATRLVTPATEFDVVRSYKHHNVRGLDVERGTNGAQGIGTYGRVSFDWPFLVPYAPKFSRLVVPGRYTFEAVATQTPCLIVLPSSGGRRIDLNLYFVGIQGINASNAVSDRDMREVLERLNALYRQVGIEIGEVRYLDADEEAAQRYAVIRDELDLSRLMAYGKAEDSTLRAHLSVDVFLVRDILLSGGAVIGSAGGVPGAAGMHGNGNNGLVFQLSSLGSDNETVAHVMAHEIGHFLGLRHTTELLRGAGGIQEARFDELVGLTDPLDDTPECRSPQELRLDCPDIDNLMFPTVPPPGAHITPALTPEQGFVLRANPLTY